MSERIRKINGEIKKAVGQFLLRELPEHSGIITVTVVETTPDLKKATVWYSYLGEEQEKKLTALLKRERGACQKHVNSTLHLKFLPKIEFQLDTSGDYAQKISAIMRDIK